MFTENDTRNYFRTIVAERSISKAAGKLMVSQPYLSQYVNKLEEKFGVKLLDRSKTPIEITPAGYIYNNYLENEYQLARKLSTDFDQLNKNRASVLHLGFGPWRGSILLPEVLPEFLKTHPQVQILLHERPLDVIYKLIEEDKLDFSIMTTYQDTPDNISADIICYETAYLVGHKDHPLIPQVAEYIEKGQPDEALRLIKDEMFFMLNNKQPVGSRVHKYLEKHHVYPTNRVETTNTTTSINCIGKKLGFGFIINTGINSASKNENLVFFDLKTPELYAPLCVVYKKNATFSLAAKEFIDIVKAYYLPYALKG